MWDQNLFWTAGFILPRQQLPIPGSPARQVDEVHHQVEASVEDEVEGGALPCACRVLLVLTIVGPQEEPPRDESEEPRGDTVRYEVLLRGEDREADRYGQGQDHLPPGRAGLPRSDAGEDRRAQVLGREKVGRRVQEDGELDPPGRTG